MKRWVVEREMDSEVHGENVEMVGTGDIIEVWEEG